MATYHDLIKRSLRLIGVAPKGNVDPPQEDTNDAFTALGHLFDEISSERWGIYTVNNETVTLTSSDNSYTIGASGGFTSGRPKKILKAWIRESNIDYPIEIIARERYNNIPDKTSTGRPYYLYYEETYPNGTFKLYPTPDSAYSLYFDSWKEITKPTAITDTVNLPSEYTQFFVYELATCSAPEYGREVPQSVFRNAQKARRRLKNIHASNVPRASSDPFNRLSDYQVDGDYWA